MLIVELVAGLALVAVGTFVFWRIGQPDGVSPRLRQMPGIESLVVLLVLGGWAGGGSFVLHSVLAMFTP